MHTLDSSRLIAARWLSKQKLRKPKKVTSRVLSALYRSRFGHFDRLTTRLIAQQAAGQEFPLKMCRDPDSQQKARQTRINFIRNSKARKKRLGTSWREQNGGEKRSD
jgi:hypothetical protein